MPEEHKVEFLPFHAINEFMRPDFRLAIVRSTLSALDSLPKTIRAPIDHLTKQVVKVPGFRHSEKAPTAVKVLPMAKAFENSPDLVAAILSAWASSHAELCQQMYTLLEIRGWKIFPTEFHGVTDLPELKKESDWGILPIQTDRTRMPGFLIYWPKSETFEAIYDDFADHFPEAEYSIDEVSLMAVWLSLRLPYQTVERDNQANADPNKPPDKTTETKIES